MKGDARAPAWLIGGAANQLARRGFEIRRHSARRRQAMLVKHQVDLVLDVGAAGGWYGSSVRRFGYAGRIISFEPLAAAYALLAERSADDALWSAHNVALGATAGTATINIASNSDSSSLLPMLDAHRHAAPGVDYVGQETVTVVRLDDLGPDLIADSQRLFLKIDTQGSEREVLAGGPRALMRCVGLQLELSFVPLYDGGMLVDEAVSWAYDRGFHLVGIEQGYAAPSGEILQVDGVFVRTPTED